MAKTQAQPRRKLLGVPLQKGISRDADGALIVRGYFTSDRRDEIGDIITRAATERAVPKYRQWGNIRYMHLPRPVAKVLRIGAEDGLEWNEVEIKVIDPQAAFEVENGLLAALSVGILINPEDVDILSDGGWQINDYSLAEISLVDHPANYDAYLKEADDDLRRMVRQYGLGAVAVSMKNLLDGENPMDETELITDVVDEPVAAEQQPIEDEAKEVPAPAEAVQEMQDVAAEKSADENPHEDSDGESNQADALHAYINELRDLIGELRQALTDAKTAAKAQEAAEQSDGDAISQTADVEIEDIGAPTDRKGFVAGTDSVIDEAEAEKSGAAPVVKSLRTALEAHFKNYPRR